MIIKRGNLYKRVYYTRFHGFISFFPLSFIPDLWFFYWRNNIQSNWHIFLSKMREKESCVPCLIVFTIGSKKLSLLFASSLLKMIFLLLLIIIPCFFDTLSYITAEIQLVLNVDKTFSCQYRYVIPGSSKKVNRYLFLSIEFADKTWRKGKVRKERTSCGLRFFSSFFRASTSILRNRDIENDDMYTYLYLLMSLSSSNFLPFGKTKWWSTIHAFYPQFLSSFPNRYKWIQIHTF